MRRSRDSSAPETLGAKPPSSPTLAAGSQLCSDEKLGELTINTVLLGDDLLQDVVSLGTHLDGLGERGSTGGEDHELLESKSVTGVGTTVDDVEGGAGENVRGLDTSKGSDPLVKGDTLFVSLNL